MLRRLRLLHPQLGVNSNRAAVAFAIVAWLPLLFLSMLQGVLLGGVAIPFLHDIAAHTRFLFAMPALILADIPVGFRLREMVRHFLNAGLIAEGDRTRFVDILVAVTTLRDSRAAEIAVVALAYTATYMNFAQLGLQHGSTWYAPDQHHPSLAGFWYLSISLPIFQFLIYRWIYRMLLWSVFLRRVSQLDLKLTPAHPDAAGGLGFLGKSLVPFGTITFALSAVVSGAIATRVIFANAKLESFATVYVALLIVTLIIFAGPLLIFTPRLFRLKYTGMLEYGVFAGRYTQLFDHKWVKADNRGRDATLLGSADIQSLADLGNSYELVHKMRLIPVERSDFIALAVPAIVPALPLLTTVMPLTEILKDLVRLIA